MGEVALTRIQHGGEGEWDRVTGVYTQTKAPKVFNPGDKVSGLSADEMKALRASGSVGDESLLATVANSTAAVLQSEEYDNMVESDLAAAGANLVNVPAPTPPSEDEIAEAHAIRTDQVARAAGEEPTLKPGEDKPAKASKSES